MRTLFLLSCVAVLLVAHSSIAAGQNVLFFGNPGSSSTGVSGQEDTLSAIETYVDNNFPMATKTVMDSETGCGFFETFDTTTYDIIIYMKLADWSSCPGAEAQIEMFASTGGVFVFAGSAVGGNSDFSSGDLPFVQWFGASSITFSAGPWTADPAAPPACDVLLAGATSMPAVLNSRLISPSISCATSPPGTVWALKSNVVGAGVIAFLADDLGSTLFNSDPTHDNAIGNLMALAAANGGMTDPHIFSRPIFGSHTHSHELVSLLAAHSLGTRDSLLASPTWVQVAVSDQVDVSCLLGDGVDQNGTYFTGLRIDAGGDSLRLASVAEGDDLLLGVEDSNDVTDICSRGSEEQLEYELAGGLAHVTVTCDMAEAREKLEGDAFMMGHVGWTKGRTQARAEVRTADYLVVAYYVQQNYSANIARWRGEPTGFFNVEAQPLPGGVFGGLFGNSLEAGMQEMRAVASTPSEAEARLVASFVHQE